MTAAEPVIEAARLRPGQRFEFAGRTVTVSRVEHDAATPNHVQIHTEEGPRPIFVKTDVVLLAD